MRDFGGGGGGGYRLASFGKQLILRCRCGAFLPGMYSTFTPHWGQKTRAPLDWDRGEVLSWLGRMKNLDFRGSADDGDAAKMGGFLIVTKYVDILACPLVMSKSDCRA